MIRFADRRLWWIFLAGAIALLLIFRLLAAVVSPANVTGQAPSIVNFLSAESVSEFAQVVEGRKLEFPIDHAAHPEFRQEWWYWVGNLTDQSGREFGYQLTFFRFANDKESAAIDSSWQSNQTWMTHLAITDVAANEFYVSQDFSRQAIGLAGAKANPFAVWVNGWSARQSDSKCDNCFNATLSARSEQIALQLDVMTNSSPVLQGNQGYSIKHKNSAVASYYYSYPDLQTSGTLQINGQTFNVTGTTWMDREWSSAMLATGQAGWDWFAMHLDDGRKLMLFQVRSESDPSQTYRHGVLINQDRTVQLIDAENIELTPGSTWKSSDTGVSYPINWQVEIQSESFTATLNIKPKVKQQEVNLFFSYYEGAVDVTGVINEITINGVGYMELTGYE